MTSAATSLTHFPPHLREVCGLLARGLVRLRSRTADDIARDLGVHGESSLHFPPDQSVCANPNQEGLA